MILLVTKKVVFTAGFAKQRANCVFSESWQRWLTHVKGCLPVMTLKTYWIREDVSDTSSVFFHIANRMNGR